MKSSYMSLQKVAYKKEETFIIDIIWFEDTFHLGRESSCVSEMTESNEDASVQMSWLLS